MCPLPAVLPVPEPGPRPSRLTLRTAPEAYLKLLPFITTAFLSLLHSTDLFVIRCDRFHFDQMADPANHTLNLRRIIMDSALMQPPYAQGFESPFLSPVPTYSTSSLCYTQPCRHAYYPFNSSSTLRYLFRVISRSQMLPLDQVVPAM